MKIFTRYFVSVLLVLISTANSQHLFKCGFTPSLLTTPACGTPISTIDTTIAACILCCPNSLSTNILPGWYQNITSVGGLYNQASSGVNMFRLELITDGRNLFRSDLDLDPANDFIPEQFVENVLLKVDQVVDFNDYDRDHDGYVDFVVFTCIFSSTRSSSGTINTLCNGFVTNDPWAGHPGEFIQICDRPSIQCLIQYSRPQLEHIIPAHEYGHHLGWPEMEKDDTGPFDHYSLGGFDVMAEGGLKQDAQACNIDTKLSVPNPWFKQSAGWHSPTPITSSQIGLELKDITSTNESYVYAPASIPGSASGGQRWLIARYTNITNLFNTWNMDPVLGGILVFHIDKPGSAAVTDNVLYRDYRKMPIDLEVASGKFDWNHGNVENSLSGRDSLENYGVYSEYLVGSNGAFFRPDANMEFAFYKNPNSNFRYADGNAPFEYAQGVTSGLAMKNITHSGDNVYVDVLLDDYEVTTNGTLCDGRWEINGTITVKSGVDLTIEANADVYMQSGCDLIIEDNATVHCNGLLNMQNRNIVFQGSNSQMIVSRRDALRGVSEIVNGNITFEDGYDVPSGETVTLSSGCSVKCLQGTNSTINVYGTLRFATAGLTDTYSFGDCISQIHVFDGGMIDIPHGGVLLENVPDVFSDANSQIVSHGDAPPNDGVVWKFRRDANVDIYGWIDADYSSLAGMAPQGVQEYWNGILVVYPESKIQMDYCTIKDIYASSTVGGCAVHLYQSANADNHIASCDIIRQDPLKLYGNGIFMQYIGSPSFLDLSCSNILDRWWTGIAVVGSNILVHTSKSMENRIGAYYLWGSQAEMDGNCIESCTDEGIKVDNAQLRLITPGNGRGNNRIVDNSNVQIELINNSEAVGGMTIGQSWYIGCNNISSSDGTRLLYLDNASTATLEGNWWGLNPEYYDATGCHYYQPTLDILFSVNGGSMLDIEPMLCSQVLRTCSINCVGETVPDPGSDVTTNSVSTSSASLTGTAKSLSDLYSLAECGNFPEVYRFLDTLIKRNPVYTDLAASLILRLEQRNSSKSSAHRSASASRIFPWLQGKLHSQMAPAMNSSLMRVLTTAYFLEGDETNAEFTAQSLRNQYPRTRNAAAVLPYLQLIAMNQRDSVKMNNAIADMVSEGFSSHEIMIARTMQRAYHRVIPKSKLPKHSSYGNTWTNTQTSDTPSADSFKLRNYPNPFNPSTLIEYTLPEEMDITLTIYSALGEKIAVVESGLRGAGFHRVKFEAPSHIPSGIYIYALQTPMGTERGRMILTK
jgi:M6 family metalloprotease-like protein